MNCKVKEEVAKREMLTGHLKGRLTTGILQESGCGAILFKIFIHVCGTKSRCGNEICR